MKKKKAHQLKGPLTVDQQIHTHTEYRQMDMGEDTGREK